MFKTLHNEIIERAINCHEKTLQIKKIWHDFKLEEINNDNINFYHYACLAGLSQEKMFEIIKSTGWNYSAFTHIVDSIKITL